MPDQQDTAASTPPEASDIKPSAAATPTRRRVRRTPNFGLFMITGGFIGFLVGAIIASTGSNAQGYSTRTGVVLIGFLTAAVGVLVATIVALVLEKLLNRE